MCTSATEWTSSPFVFSIRNRRSKRYKVRIHGLRRKRCEEKIEKEMELKNLKLYMENITMIEENDKLRKKASLLQQENLTLMSVLQQKLLSQFNRVSTIPPHNTDLGFK